MNHFLSKCPSRNFSTSSASAACPEIHYYEASSLNTSHALNFHNLYKYIWYRKPLVVKEGKFGEKKDLYRPTGAGTPLPTNTQRESQLRKERWDLGASSETLLGDNPGSRPGRLWARQSVRLCLGYFYLSSASQVLNK